MNQHHQSLDMMIEWKYAKLAGAPKEKLLVEGQQLLLLLVRTMILGEKW